MNVLKLTLAAVALTMGAGAAHADYSRAPRLNATAGDSLSVADVGVRRVIETRRRTESPLTGQSRLTIFGHEVAGHADTRPYDHAASAGN